MKEILSVDFKECNDSWAVKDFQSLYCLLLQKDNNFVNDKRLHCKCDH